MKRCAFWALVLGCLAGSVSAAEWYGSWGYRQKITLNHTSVSNNLADFPVLIAEGNVKPALFTNALSNGNDILFTSSNGLTKLSHQIESYDAVGQKIAAWVKLPSLSKTVDTEIYVYYGKPTAANQEDITNVWANGYVGVWHLNEQSGLHMDSTLNTNNATTNGLVDMTATGKVDGADAFDSSVSSYLNTGARETDADIDIGTNSLTLSVWCKPNPTLAATDYILADGYNGGATNYGGFDIMHSASSLILYFAQADRKRIQIQFSHGGNVWKHVTVTWDKDSSLLSMYKDGVVNGSIACVGHTPYNASTIRIASNSGGSQSSIFDGSIDEVRISRGARSADWIATEYNNQNNPASFASAAAEEVLTRGTLIFIR